MKDTALDIGKNGTLQPFGCSPKCQLYIGKCNCYEAYQKQTNKKQRIMAGTIYGLHFPFEIFL